MCISILVECIYMCHICALFPQRSEEGVVSLETRALNGSELPCEYWELSSNYS